MKAHFFWSGPMSWLRFQTLNTFRHYNPDVEMIVHTASARQLRAVDKDYWPFVADLDVTLVTHSGDPDVHPASVCDLIRWNTMAWDSGVFCDMDIVFANPLSLHADLFTRDALMVDDGFFYIGLMHSCGDSDLFREAYETARRLYLPDGYQSCGVDALYVMAYGDAIRASGHVDWGQAQSQDSLSKLPYGVGCIPKRLLHYYPECDMLRPLGGPPTEIIGLHWSGGGCDYESVVTEENYSHLQGPLIIALKDVLGGD